MGKCAARGLQRALRLGQALQALGVASLQWERGARSHAIRSRPITPTRLPPRERKGEPLGASSTLSLRTKTRRLGGRSVDARLAPAKAAVCGGGFRA
jgi:hypothetical protein